jgi:hypothetical protein
MRPNAYTDTDTDTDTHSDAHAYPYAHSYSVTFGLRSSVERRHGLFGRRPGQRKHGELQGQLVDAGQ